MALPEIVKALKNPSSYSPTDEVVKVELIETHISWVFLTDKYAFKLKKPVKFDFLDFSSVELRRVACETELRLNRRLAPDVYLCVLPVSEFEEGRLRFNAEGKTLDWVVKMRRLEATQALDVLISEDRVTESAIQQVAERLLSFYADTASVSISTDDYLRELTQHVQGNRHALQCETLSQYSQQVRRIHGAQLRFLATQQHLFAARVAKNRIVDGHGDLRPEHVYLETTPVIIDCIEFNDEFRRLDELDELCFLAMECTMLAARWIGEMILKRYQSASGDELPDSLVAFYTAYRACVRAKVNLLRAAQVDADEAKKLLGLSEKYLQVALEAAGKLGDPLLLVVRGPAGVGKTTLASQLAEVLGGEHLQTDQIRRQLFGLASSLEDRYTEQSRLRVYQEMFSQAGEMLQAGSTVVLDGTFLTLDLQQECHELAKASAARLLMVNCSLSAESATDRIRERAKQGDSLSDATEDTHRQQRAFESPPPPHLPQCNVDTSETPSDLVQAVLRQLADLYGTM
jgi:aminoglycoside phosphotransferase family enzyme/predicted kinase